MCCLKSIQIFIFKSCDCLFPWWPLVEWQSRIFLRFCRIFHVLFRWFSLSSDRFYYTPQLSTRPVWRRLEKSLKDWFENVSDVKKQNKKIGVISSSLDKPEEYHGDLIELKKQYDLDSNKICYLRKPSSSWIRIANELLQANFDHKRIWFGCRATDDQYHEQVRKGKRENAKRQHAHYTRWGILYRRTVGQYCIGGRENTDSRIDTAWTYTDGPYEWPCKAD